MFHIHRWTDWKTYEAKYTGILHQTRFCRGCKFIEDRVPVHDPANLKIYKARKKEAQNV